MTPNRVTVALEKYTRCIDSSDQAVLKSMLASADNSCTDELMYLPMKSPVATILLSLFLGGLGVDRFYVGDNKMGIAKLIARIASVTFLSGIPVLGTIASLAVSVWLIADIFITYKMAKKKNLATLTEFLRKHKQKTRPASNAGRPRSGGNLNNAMADNGTPTRRRLSDFIEELEAEESNSGGKQEEFGYTEPENTDTEDSGDNNGMHTTGYNSLNDMDEDNENSEPPSANTSRDDGRRAGEDPSSGRSTSNPFSW